MEAINTTEKEISGQARENVRKYNQAVTAAKKTALYEYGDARRWQEFFFYKETAA
jgi:hypothetical protein